MIVENLPLLTHLDISGTNLAGTGVAQFEAKEKVKSSDIPGLVSRANNPLHFLGLYNTAHSACRRHDIPAIKVSLFVNTFLITQWQHQYKYNIMHKYTNDMLFKILIKENPCVRFCWYI